MSALYLDHDLLDAEPGDALILSGAEARHAGTVARVSVGESLVISNGRGLMVDSTVVSVARDALQCRVMHVSRHPVPLPRIVLVQSLAKGGRDELAIQTATELGVAGIIPWQAERSIVRWSPEKQQKNVQRWQSIVQEAAKQSLNPWIPEVLGVHNTQQLVNELSSDELKIVLEPTATVSLVEQFPQLIADNPKQSIYLFVGPEGGITPRELQQLADWGALLVKMGDLVLRSSTAGPTALALINAFGHRW